MTNIISSRLRSAYSFLLKDTICTHFILVLYINILEVKERLSINETEWKLLKNMNMSQTIYYHELQV